MIAESPIHNHRSACPLDCPDSCEFDVAVQEGRVVKLDGGRNHPLTDGYICGKVRRLPEVLYGPDRLLYPSKRVGAKGEGRFERISWDEALSTIAQKFREIRERSGGEAILPLAYGGSNGVLTHDSIDARLFRRLGSPRVARTLCAAPTRRVANAFYGRMAGVALHDFKHARLIVVWGTNPQVSGIHVVPRIREAKAAGAKLVVIDPRQTPLAKQADLHLAVKPGTDVAVALAVHRFLWNEGHAALDFLAEHAEGWETLRERCQEWTFERAAELAGVAANDIETLARWYAEISPAVIRVGWGSERNRNGGSATAAIMALPAVGGKFGVRGGGYTQSNSGIWNLDSEGAIAEPEAQTRRINMNQIGRALTTEIESERIEALFVYNCNPLQTLPNQELVRRGLLRDDLFTVVFDPIATDTVAYADIALPATAMLEHRDLVRGYGAMVMHDAPKVAETPGEGRSNMEVFAELLHRLDLAKPGEPETVEELRAALLARDPRVAEELARDGIASPTVGHSPIQFVDEFPRTPDRKIHLFPEDLEREAPLGLYRYQPDPATAEFPLALISPANNRAISSSLSQLIEGDVPVDMNPEDAKARGLADGDRVRVWNALGEVHCRVRLTNDHRPGVAAITKGIWARHTQNGASSNALSPDDLTDLGGGACFNDARVEVAGL